MQQQVVASCILGSAFAASAQTPLVADVSGPTAEIRLLQPSRRILSVSAAAAVGEAIQTIQIDNSHRSEARQAASELGSQLTARPNGRISETKGWIDLVLLTYFCGGALSITRAIVLMAQFATLGFHWQPFIIPAAAGFAFIPLGWAGYLVFSGRGTCSYANSALNFIIPVSDLPACGGRSYNFPEFLVELVTLSALFSSIYVVFLSRYFKAQFAWYTEPNASWLLLGCKLLRILGVSAMIGLVGVAWIPTHFYKLVHRTAAYVFFLASIWMLFLYGLLVASLPDNCRRPFLLPAAVGTMLWILMTIYGVQFTFNFCDKICGGGDFSQEPRSLQLQKEELSLYEKYRWCLSLESVAEWIIVALYALWVLLAPVATTLPCRDAGRKSHEAVGETAADETRNAYS
ncbi:FOLD2 [Symbiodinium necroappetens]|uniref:FOLD2 protein n=1 Tax=Symbiodinium necroappetens TaxID=1628268 RepID=A0A812SFS8_9DINO|nr:FOLD2 [Symbiodinium necroappetens]